jgi:hypothetical protein
MFDREMTKWFQLLGMGMQLRALLANHGHARGTWDHDSLQKLLVGLMEKPSCVLVAVPCRAAKHVQLHVVPAADFQHYMQALKASCASNLQRANSSARSLPVSGTTRRLRYHSGEEGCQNTLAKPKATCQQAAQ